MTGKWENLRLERNYSLVAIVIISFLLTFALLSPHLLVLCHVAENCLAFLLFPLLALLHLPPVAKPLQLPVKVVHINA